MPNIAAGPAHLEGAGGMGRKLFLVMPGMYNGLRATGLGVALKAPLCDPDTPPLASVAKERMLIFFEFLLLRARRNFI